MEDFKDCQDYMDLMEAQENGSYCTCDGIGEEACLDCPLYIEN